MDEITFKIAKDVSEYAAIQESTIRSRYDCNTDQWIEILKMLTELKGFSWDVITAEIVAEYISQKDLNND